MANKRTNVRSAPPAVRALFRVLNPMPSLASEVATKIWTTPPRAPLRPPQAEILSRAERLHVEAGGTRVVGYAWGNGPAVLLIHGWGGHAGQLTSFVPALVEAGHRAIAFDAPRHGATVGGTPTIPAFVDAARALADEVGGVEAVIGHSMGAAATAYALGRGFEASRAVLLASPVSMTVVAERFARTLGLGTEGLERMRKKFERRYGLSFADFEAVRDAARIRSEVLVVHDKEDPDVPYEDGVEIVRAWPTARLFTTEGLGHHRILRDPDVVRNAIDFIAARARRSQAR